MELDGTVLLVAAELAGGLVALLTGLQARKAHRVSPSPSLSRFAAGFFLLALAQLAAAATEAFAASGAPETTALDALDLLDGLFWTYHASLLAGLALVFASFGRHPFRWTPVLAPLVLVAGPVLQFLVIVALFFVVLHAGLNHIARARPGSLQTAVGFFLLLLGQFLFLYDYVPLTPRSLPGEAASLLGYLLLWQAIARPRGVR